MSNVRIIPRLDIKAPNLIKGIHLEGLRVVGNPQEFAVKYYEQGADELIYMDIVASLYNRNSLGDLVKKSVQNVFIPITVGGGIRSVDNAKEILRCGADKIAINTAAIKRPELLSELSRRFGSQCIVLSIEAKKCAPGKWEAYYDNGREHSGRDVVEWAQHATELGVGEILLTSVDKEGTRKGMDTELIRAVSAQVPIPVIASGGFGKPEDFVSAVKDGKADAVAIADAFHYERLKISDVRAKAIEEAIDVRRIGGIGDGSVCPHAGTDGTVPNSMRV